MNTHMTAEPAIDVARVGMAHRMASLWQKITTRFSEATEDFRFEYQRRLQVAPVVLTSAFVETRIAAFLISEVTSEVLALQEGTNVYKVNEKGIEPTERPQNPYERPDVTLLVTGDRVVKEEKEGTPSKFVTNDRLVIGNRSYVLKVVPEEYRRVNRQMNGTTKGKSHA